MNKNLFIFRDCCILCLFATAQNDEWAVGLLLFMLQHCQCTQWSISWTHLHHKLNGGNKSKMREKREKNIWEIAWFQTKMIKSNKNSVFDWKILTVSCSLFLRRFSILFLPGPFPWNLCDRYRNASFSFSKRPLSSIYSNLTFGL